MILSVSGVKVTYPARRRGGADARAVDGVSLQVRPGEVVAVVGESGCGKTTLARAIVGLQSFTEGTITFAGQTRSTKHVIDKKLRAEIQMVFQDPSGSLNPRHTVYEIVAEGLRIHKRTENEAELVKIALEQCGLHPAERYMSKHPHELSGGQRQRVVIAGAMVMKPQLLVADEPVSSLDASVRGEILALLQKLARENNMALLVITHDLGLPWNIADRILVMYLGRIVEVGDTEDVLAAPQHPYTRALLSVVHESSQLEQQILTGEAPDPTNIPAGCRFHPRCPVVQSGEAARHGFLAACTSVDPELRVVAGAAHAMACHLKK